MLDGSDTKLKAANAKISDDDKIHVKTVLDKHQWIIARAASELGLSRQALYRRIEKHQLEQGQ
jgi:transcriptional regulator of acetoin/glycerol metabolism